VSIRTILGQTTPSESNGSMTRIKERLQRHFQIVRERERNFIMGINGNSIEKWLKVSFYLFFLLYLLDVFSTFTALRFLPAAFERNLFFAYLFESGLSGYLVAIFFKFILILPIMIVVLFPLRRSKNELVMRILKIATLAGILAAIIIYSYIVLFNNIPILISYI
jgi:hypothetical protein